MAGVTRPTISNGMMKPRKALKSPLNVRKTRASGSGKKRPQTMPRTMPRSTRTSRCDVMGFLVMGQSSAVEGKWANRNESPLTLLIQ